MAKQKKTRIKHREICTKIQSKSSYKIQPKIRIYVQSLKGSQKGEMLRYSKLYFIRLRI